MKTLTLKQKLIACLLWLKAGSKYILKKSLAPKYVVGSYSKSLRKHQHKKSSIMSMVLAVSSPASLIDSRLLLNSPLFVTHWTMRISETPLIKIQMISSISITWDKSSNSHNPLKSGKLPTLSISGKTITQLSFMSLRNIRNSVALSLVVKIIHVQNTSTEEYVNLNLEKISHKFSLLKVIMI